jgi:hypothetical protein
MLSTGTCQALLDRSIVETTLLWHCTKTMFESEWRLLTTLPDLPSAQSLAQILSGEGLSVQVRSEASVLGQAAPSRLYVAAAQLQRAQASLAQRQLTDEELTQLAGAAPPVGGEP